MAEYVITVHEEDGGLWGEVAGLPGCFVSGADMDELLDAAAEAIPMYLAETPPAGNVLTLPVREAERHDYSPTQARILLEA